MSTLINANGTSAGTRNPIAGASSFYQTCQTPEILESFYCETFVDRVSEGRRLQGVMDQNKLEYRFSKTSEPTVHGALLSNAEYTTPEMPTVSECVIRLGQMAYTNEKWDDETYKYMTKEADSVFRQDRNEKTGNALAQKHMADFMCWLGTQVHPCNEGNTAGKVSGAIKLGTRDAPINLNPNTAGLLGIKLHQVLDEHLLPMNRAMIIPSVVAMLLRTSKANTQANIGRGTKEYMASQCADLSDFAPCGDDIYQYTCLQGVKNASNQTVFPVYYVWKSALDTAHGMDARNSGIFASDQSRGPLYHVNRNIIRYGFSTIYCQGIARAWVTVDPQWDEKANCTSC
jgi:hypothetical protein